MYCHVAVNARDCTFTAEWRCVSHCHSTSSVPRRYVQGRVAVPLTRGGTLGAEWQCHSHCHSMVSVPRRYAQGRVAVPLTRGGTFGAEWQCHSHCHSMVSVRGSASHTATRWRAYGAVRLTLPLDVERTKMVRSGPSGSVGPSDLRANRRCADAKTCLERAGTDLAQDGPFTSGGRSFGGRVSRPVRLMCSVLPILLRRHNPNRGTKDRKTD